MRILALETATGIGSVALRDGDRTVERDFDPRGQGAVAALHHLLTEEKVRPGEIDAFAVSIGPGSFTGIRIGVSVAQGFCRATTARAVPVGTLEGLAWAGHESDWGVPGMVLLPSVDARRGEVYAAVYRARGSGRDPARLWGPEVVSCAELAERLVGLSADDTEGVLLGDGGGLLAPLLPGRWAAPAALARPRAGVIARVAAAKLTAGEWVPPDRLVPEYVRKSDAESRRERRPATD